MAKKTNNIVGPVLCVIALTLLLCSCGYQLVQEKGIYGGEITSLYLSIFKNNTYEPGVSQYVTESFSREFLSTGLFVLNKEKADGYLQGSVQKVSTIPATMSAAAVTIEKTVTVEVEIALFKKNGDFVQRWKLSDSETYRVDNVDFEDYNKKDAIKRLSLRLARRFNSMLLTNY